MANGSPPARVLFWAILLGAIFYTLFGAASFGMSLYSVIELQSIPRTKIVTPYFAEPMMGDPELAGKSAVAGCTNISLGMERKVFDGTTYIFKRCDEPSNQCLQALCMDNGECTSVLKDTSSCSDDSFCTNITNGFCNPSTCQCESRVMQCTEDTDCGVSNNTCGAFTCGDDGICNFGRSNVSECLFNSDCTGSNQYCDDSCTCLQLPGQVTEYTPTFTPVDLGGDLVTVWDLDNITELTVFYTTLQNNYIRIDGSAVFRQRNTTERYIGFEFTLPLGFTGSPIFPGTGSFGSSPNFDGLQTDPDPHALGIGRTVVTGTTTAQVQSYNNNPLYIGPSNDIETYLVTFSLLYPIVLV